MMIKNKKLLHMPVAAISLIKSRQPFLITPGGEKKVDNLNMNMGGFIPPIVYYEDNDNNKPRNPYRLDSLTEKAVIDFRSHIREDIRGVKVGDKIPKGMSKSYFHILNKQRRKKSV